MSCDACVGLSKDTTTRASWSLRGAVQSVYSECAHALVADRLQEGAGSFFGLVRVRFGQHKPRAPAIPVIAPQNHFVESFDIDAEQFKRLVRRRAGRKDRLQPAHRREA